jgi:glucose-6-phosphate isomerase
VLEWARGESGRLDDVVVLGIGGSALGTVAVRTALLARDWNRAAAGSARRPPRLHVLDNVDPRAVRAVLDDVDLARTRFLVISKSGSTAETMAQYLAVRDRLRTAGLPVREHLAFVTDPEKGALRRIAAPRGSRRSRCRRTSAGASPSSPPWARCRRRCWGSTWTR